MLVGSDDGKLRALNATNGGAVWEVHTGDEVESSPAVGWWSGRMIIMCTCWGGGERGWAGDAPDGAMSGGRGRGSGRGGLDWR